jgi:hypothetical protein
MTDSPDVRAVFEGWVGRNGDLHAHEVNATRGRLSRWVRGKERRVLVTVSRYVKPKTNPQLGLYFREGGILDAWVDYTGYDRDECHTELKRAFLAPVLAVAKLTGEEVREIPSLADLTSEQMSEFLERVLREGRQRGIEFDLRDVA